MLAVLMTLVTAAAAGAAQPPWSPGDRFAVAVSGCADREGNFRPEDGSAGKGAPLRTSVADDAPTIAVTGAAELEMTHDFRLPVDLPAYFKLETGMVFRDAGTEAGECLERKRQRYELSRDELSLSGGSGQLSCEGQSAEILPPAAQRFALVSNPDGFTLVNIGLPLMCVQAYPYFAERYLRLPR